MNRDVVPASPASSRIGPGVSSAPGADHVGDTVVAVEAKSDPAAEMLQAVDHRRGVVAGATPVISLVPSASAAHTSARLTMLFDGGTSPGRSTGPSARRTR